MQLQLEDGDGDGGGNGAGYEAVANHESQVQGHNAQSHRRLHKSHTPDPSCLLLPRIPPYPHTPVPFIQAHTLIHTQSP